MRKSKAKPQVKKKKVAKTAKAKPKTKKNPARSKSPKRKKTSKGGRPRSTVKERVGKIKFNIKKIEQLARLGHTESEIAQLLDINERTLLRWKDDEGFCRAIKRGKIDADSKVTQSLYDRAIGCKMKDTHFASFRGHIRSKKYIRHFLGDVTAQIFWLCNRRPEEFRRDASSKIPNKYSDEELEIISPERAKQVQASGMNFLLS